MNKLFLILLIFSCFFLHAMDQEHRPFGIDYLLYTRPSSSITQSTTLVIPLQDDDRMEAQNEQQTIFYCHQSECTFHSTNRTVLQKHLTTAHFNTAPYKCIACKQVFSSEGYLKKHERGKTHRKKIHTICSPKSNDTEGQRNNPIMIAEDSTPSNSEQSTYNPMAISSILNRQLANSAPLYEHRTTSQDQVSQTTRVIAYNIHKRPAIAPDALDSTRSALLAETIKSIRAEHDRFVADLRIFAETYKRLKQGQPVQS